MTAFQSIKEAIGHNKHIQKHFPEAYQERFELFNLLIPAGSLAMKLEKFEESISFTQKAKDIFEQILNLKGQNKSIILLVKGA